MLAQERSLHWIPRLKKRAKVSLSYAKCLHVVQLETATVRGLFPWYWQGGALWIPRDGQVSLTFQILLGLLRWWGLQFNLAMYTSFAPIEAYCLTIFKSLQKPKQSSCLPHSWKLYAEGLHLVWQILQSILLVRNFKASWCNTRDYRPNRHILEQQHPYNMQPLHTCITAICALLASLLKQERATSKCVSRIIFCCHGLLGFQLTRNTCTLMMRFRMRLCKKTQTSLTLLVWTYLSSCKMMKSQEANEMGTQHAIASKQDLPTRADRKLPCCQ